MRALSLLFAVVALSVAPFNSSKAQSGRHIQWGHGGLRWVIYENRQVYKLDMEGQHSGQGGMWDKRAVADLFDDFDKLKFEKVISNNMSGDYYIIKCISSDGAHQVAWVNPSDLGKYKHGIIYFYGMLQEFEEQRVD